MKKLALFILLAVGAALLSGCNYNIIDTKFSFDRAIIRQPDGEVVELRVKSWSDSDGEQLTITATDGKVYLVSANYCMMIDD